VKVEDPALEAEMVRCIKAAGQPVSTDYVAHNLNLCWATAKTVLLTMALKKQIKAVKTTKSFIFVAAETIFSLPTEKKAEAAMLQKTSTNK
jgi:hypothetical protein